MMSFRRVLTLAAVASFALSACGGNKPAPPPPPPGDSGTRDSARDSATDSAAPDSALDGGLDSATRDGGTGEAFPGCTETIFEEIVLGSDVRGFQQTVSVAPAASSWGLAWSDASDGPENIRVRLVPSVGSLGTTQRISEGFGIARGGAILSVGSAFLAGYYDNSEFDAGFEVFLRQLDASGTPTAAASRLTTNMVRDDSPAFLRMGLANLVVWVEDNLTTRVAKAAIVSDMGVVIGAVHTLTTPPESPTTLTLSALSGGAGLAWVESRADGADAVLLRVDTTGALVSGSKVSLSTERNAAGSVDVASDSTTGGAAVFDVSVSGVRPEVRFREVAADGTLPAPERIVTLAPARGRDASLAPLAGGYVVAYRALADGTLTQPTLRLTLLDIRGDVLRSFDGPVVMAAGGRTTVRVSGDGRVLVAWEDLNEVDGSRQLRAVRVRCAVDGPAMDGGVFTDGGTDSGSGRVDASFDSSIPDAGGACDLLPACDLAAPTCPMGSTCVDGICGGTRCTLAGHPCRSIDECPVGSSCTPGPIGTSCTGPGRCIDSRDCPVGFACESDACVDRRTPCGASSECPRGFKCNRSTITAPFCDNAHGRCSSIGTCGVGSLCVDVDGDGASECLPIDTCTANADCPVVGEVCGASPGAVCGDYGPCASAGDCASGYACQDLWGDGVKVCVQPGGSCVSNADCPSPQVCAPPLAGGPPSCVG